MIDWNDLKYVLALRDGKTIKHAAELLKTNPTTVSRHIKKLSENLGVTLFQLSREGEWVLTAKGEELCQIASSFKTKLDHVVGSKLSQDDQETVVVTSLEFLLTHFLAKFLGEAADRMPRTQVKLLGADRRLSLAYGEADIALRFGRPTEGQLLASKIADIEFDIYHPPGKQPKSEWIGLQEELDWTPEMKLGYQTFGRPPLTRVSSFAAAREAAISAKCATIGPNVVMRMGDHLVRSSETVGVTREVWSVIHESRKTSKTLAAVREWIKESINESLRQQRATYKLQVAASKTA